MPNPIASFKTTLGDFAIELYEDKSPATVANFTAYAKAGFYDGTIFHRVIPGFMVQGGGMLPGLKEKDTKAPVKNEADTGVKNDRGTISMARTSDPHSATCQFFINLVDNKSLNFRSKDTSGWGYCAFGKVTTGMDTIDAIAKVETGNRYPHQNVPTADVVITNVTIEG
jgi:peptidyl-prolyl cis-trans isomerase B (cyclophilin B)